MIERPSNGDAIDAARIELLRGLGGARLVGEMVQLFRGFAVEQLALLDRAVAAGEPPHAARCAHAIRSSACNLGARAVQELAHAIEAHAAIDAPAAPGERARALRAAVEDAVADLDTLAGGASRSEQPRAS